MNRVIVYWLVLLAVFAVCTQVMAADLSIQWDAPTTREDGSELKNSEIAQYNIQVKPPGAANYNLLDPIMGVTDTQSYSSIYALNSGNGEYCFQLQTQDSQEFKSKWSDPVCAQYVAIANPLPPGPIIIEIRVQP